MTDADRSGSQAILFDGSLANRSGQVLTILDPGQSSSMAESRWTGVNRQKSGGKSGNLSWSYAHLMNSRFVPVFCNKL